MKILVVGSGGIGCEVLKNLVLSGYQDIELVDMDTIELSNLNRQFLFTKSNISQSKSVVAAQKMKRHNVKVVSHCRLIQEFGTPFFRNFQLVIGCLDNLEARRYVNLMCLFCNIPLIESGTAGYLGQCTYIQGKVTECFDCTEKPVPKTFPICTIRNNPTTIVHCIVWAKNLFINLFTSSADEEEAQLSSMDSDSLIEKLFVADIAKVKALKPERMFPEWEELDTRNYISAFKKSRDRIGSCEDFDKDDEDHLEFVSTSTNLRALVFSISTTSKFEIKAIAGNIIPAIASTNAVISGLVCNFVDKIRDKLSDTIRSVFLRRVPLKNKVFSVCKLSSPSTQCKVCSRGFCIAKLSTKTTLRELLENILKDSDIEIEHLTVMTGSSLIFDFDYDENLEKRILDLNLEHNLLFIPEINLSISIEKSEIVDVSFTYEYHPLIAVDRLSEEQTEKPEKRQKIEESPIDVDDNIL